MSSAALITEAEQIWKSEALRLYRRYQTEFIERFALCPWAKKARQSGAVSEQVLLGEAIDTESVLEAIRGLEAAPQIEIGLLIFPQLSLSRIEFEAAAERLRNDASDARLRAFASAAFHPDAEAVADRPSRLVPFWRRSPDPTIQLVRLSALARVRKGESGGTGFVDPKALLPEDLLSSLSRPGPPMHEQVHRANFEQLQLHGIDALLEVLRDIERDRLETYSRLASR